MYLPSLIRSNAPTTVCYYNMLMGMAHGLLKFERRFPRKPKKPPLDPPLCIFIREKYFKSYARKTK